MYPVSKSNPAGDIVGHRAGLVSDFYKDRLVSAQVNKHYGNLNAVEVEYAPHGKRTGLCAGLAHTAYQNEGLTLQKCGMSAKTVWIIDTADSPSTASQGHFPLVSGSTTNFAHPYAMTFTHDSYRHGGYRHGGHRTAVPMQIRVARLMGNPTHVAGQPALGYDEVRVPQPAPNAAVVFRPATGALAMARPRSCAAEHPSLLDPVEGRAPRILPAARRLGDTAVDRDLIEAEADHAVVRLQGDPVQRLRDPQPGWTCHRGAAGDHDELSGLQTVGQRAQVQEAGGDPQGMQVERAMRLGCSPAILVSSAATAIGSEASSRR